MCMGKEPAGAGRGEETHSRFEEEQIKYRWNHFESGKEGRAAGAVVNL